MALPIAIIPIASAIGKGTMTRLGVHTLGAAWRAGGLKGFLVQVGSIIKGALVKGFSFKLAWQAITGAIRFIYTFNWNVSDDDIDARINGILNGLAGMLGGAVGQTLGWVICGAAGTTAVTKINPAAVAFISKELTEEAEDEIVGAWVSLIKSAAMKAAEGLFYWSFKSIRSFLKKSSIMQSLFGKERMENWGKKGGPVVSIAKAVEDAIESIPNSMVRNFVEEVYEEFLESCNEAGFVIASGLDNFYAQAALNRSSTLGPNRVVELKFNRDNDTEKVILAGPTESLKSQITTALAQQQVIKNKDIGIILAPSADDMIQYRIPPQTRYEAHIEYFNLVNGKPPIPRKGKIRACYKIPDFNPAYLNDFDRIKRAASTTGDSGFLSGEWFVSANLSNNGKMTVRTASEDTGKELITNLLGLSSGINVRRFLPYRQIAGGNIPASEINRASEKMYPYRITFIRHKRSVDPQVGKVRIYDGERVVYLKQCLPLWPDAKPGNWDMLITQLMMD